MSQNSASRDKVGVAAQRSVGLVPQPGLARRQRRKRAAAERNTTTVSSREREALLTSPYLMLAVQRIQDDVKNAVEGLVREVEEIRRAGIDHIFETRERALEEFLPYVLRAQENEEIMFVGSSLKTLVFAEEYVKLRDFISSRPPNNKTRFLLTHPCVGDLRAAQENRARMDIPREIISTVKELASLNVPLKSIRLYLGTPTCFGIKTRTAMLLNPYPYRAEAPFSTTFIVRKGGFVYEQFSRQHFGAWDTSMATTIDESYQTAFADSKLEQFSELAAKLLGEDERKS